MKFSLVIAFLLSAATLARAQTPDPSLMAEIRKIRAIDNHSHPPRVVASGERDDEFDALPCDPLEPTAPNTMTRPENPQYLAAWKALWGYQYDDRSDAHIKELLAAKNKIREEQGDHYPAWVLDQLGIERVSCKSLDAQGVDRESTLHMGVAATAMERKGEPTERGDPARNWSLNISRENSPSYPVTSTASMNSTSGISPCPGKQR